MAGEPHRRRALSFVTRVLVTVGTRMLAGGHSVDEDLGRAARVRQEVPQLLWVHEHRGEESDDHEVGVVVWRARGLREPWRFKRVCAAQTETHSCGGLRAPFLLPCPSGCSFQSALSTVVVTYGVLK